MFIKNKTYIRKEKTVISDIITVLKKEFKKQDDYILQHRLNKSCFYVYRYIVIHDVETNTKTKIIFNIKYDDLAKTYKYNINVKNDFMNENLKTQSKNKNIFENVKIFLEKVLTS